MDCRDVAERLPWLLNGSLTSAEAETLRAHVAGCAACRTELEETRQAAAVFDAHLPTGVVLDLAWDRTPSGVDPEVARAHLETCASCREELELARESRRLEAADEPIQPSAPRRSTALRFVLPATLAAGLVAGFALGTRRAPTTPPDDGRIVHLETEAARLRAVVATLERAAIEARPRVNLPLFELIPGLTRGTGPGATNELTVPAGATEVVLLIGLPNRPGTPASAALTDATGREVWQADGLLSGPPGGYVVTLPATLLPAGESTLRLRPEGASMVDYHLRVRR